MIPDQDKELIAYHEAGHALLSLLLKDVEVPTRVSIIAPGSGRTRSAWSQRPDREILTRRHLMAQLIVLQGGQAAEVNAFGQPSTQAEDDLHDAAKLARRMVERWAMTGRYELAGRDQDPVTRSRTEQHSQPAVAKLLSQSFQAARTILGDHDEQLRAVAEALARVETLSMTEISRIAGVPEPSRDEPATSTSTSLASVTELRA